MTLSPEEIQALLLSLRVALWCVAVTAIPGIALGWIMARRDFPGRTILDAVVHLPLVLPPVVVGYVLLVLLGKQGVIGKFLAQMGFEVAFTWKAAVIASAVMGFPLLVRAVRLSMETVDHRLEQAASTLGASPWWVFMTITLPRSLPGIVAGLILAFARSLGEFGATITFAGNIGGESRTLPLAVYSFTQSPDHDAAVARLVAISIAISLAAMIFSELLARRVKRLAEA